MLFTRPLFSCLQKLKVINWMRWKIGSELKATLGNSVFNVFLVNYLSGQFNQTFYKYSFNDITF